MKGDQRVDRAREFLDGALKRKVTELPPSVLMRELAEARRQLGQVLDFIAWQPEPGPGPGLGEEVERLVAVRALLAGFDWEFHDRQLALEEIERIVTGGAR